MNRLNVLTRPLPAFAIASLCAVAVGAAVCAQSGVPAGLWGRNLIAWLIGGLGAMAVARWSGARTRQAVMVVAPIGIAATFLFAGQEGVHRWLELGPVRVNAAMLLLPLFVAAAARLAPRAGWWWVPALLALGALVLQPDASQASALALAVCVVVIGVQRPTPPFGWALIAAALALAAFAWTRRDPLAPVPEVEGIVGLAYGLSPWLAGLMAVSVAAAALAPALVARGGGTAAVRCAGYALSALAVTWSLAPAFGAFPAPLAGIGPSPILGLWLGVGLLAAHRDDGG